MHTTHDIPTPAASLVITDTKHLSDVMTELTVLEVKADELTFELPMAAKKGPHA